MKIQTITVENFIGARAAQLECPTAVTLVAGPNAAGKSSIRDAVALALTADLGRVSLKKEAGQLVHAGQAAAFCGVVDVDGDEYGVTITEAGKITDTQKGRETDPTLPFVLDAQRFARLDLTARRAFLFDLMGVKMKPAEIKDRLLMRLYPSGCNEAAMMRVDRVLPLLRAGFDTASKEAKDKATAAKGAWRALTGETYGAVKAVEWKAPVPAFDPAQLSAAQKALEVADQAVAAGQRRLGELQAEKKAHDDQAAKVGALTEAAGKLQRAKDVAQRSETELHTWNADLAALRARAGAGPRVGLVHQLASALVDLLEAMDFLEVADHSRVAGDVVAARAQLAAYEHEHGKLGAAGDPEAAAKIPTAERSVGLYETALANAKRDIAAAERAAEDLKAIQASTWSAAPMTEATEQLVALQAAKAKAATALEQLRAAKATADSATKKTADAATHHADVEAWAAIGEALSPDGIPADLLAEAIKPINDRLEQSAADAEWPVAAIAGDMSVTAGGRAYALLSVSEKYRVDAMVAEAIAFLSNAHLLVLDGADVLDLKGRADLFAWLDVLAENGEIDSALVFATLKALPNDLPATITAHWIQGGVVAQPMKAAA